MKPGRRTENFPCSLRDRDFAGNAVAGRRCQPATAQRPHNKTESSRTLCEQRADQEAWQRVRAHSLKSNDALCRALRTNVLLFVSSMNWRSNASLAAASVSAVALAACSAMCCGCCCPFLERERADCGSTWMRTGSPAPLGEAATESGATCSNPHDLSSRGAGNDVRNKRRVATHTAGSCSRKASAVGKESKEQQKSNEFCAKPSEGHFKRPYQNASHSVRPLEIDGQSTSRRARSASRDPETSLPVDVEQPSMCALQTRRARTDVSY